MSKRHLIHDDEVITLWTIQDIPAFEKMQETGVMEVHDDKFIDPNFIPSYNWLMGKMIECGVMPSNPSQAYPIWAWYKFAGKRKVDLRSYSCSEKGVRQVRIEFDVPRNEVLLSDYLLWNTVLNNDYIGDSEQEDEFYFDNLELFSREKIEKSWEKVLNIEGNMKNPYLCTPEIQSIQATVWKINMNQVRNVKFFTQRW